MALKLKSREKLLLIFVAIAIAVFAFDRAYYTPQSRKILQLKGEIKAADQKIEQYRLLKKGEETQETEVARLEKERKGLSERTLKGEEFKAFLRHLARESDGHNMKIISLTPQEEKSLLPEGEKGGSPLQYRKVTIQMVFHATYNKLGNYLREIEKLPFLLNVDSLQVERIEEVLPLLKVTMGLSIHIISL